MCHMVIYAMHVMYVCRYRCALGLSMCVVHIRVTRGGGLAAAAVFWQTLCGEKGSFWSSTRHFSTTHVATTMYANTRYARRCVDDEMMIARDASDGPTRGRARGYTTHTMHTSMRMDGWMDGSSCAAPRGCGRPRRRSMRDVDGWRERCVGFFLSVLRRSIARGW